MTRPPATCTLCYKPPRDGCSHAKCPCRRPVTAAARGLPAGASSSTGLRAFEPNRLENLK